MIEGSVKFAFNLWALLLQNAVRFSAIRKPAYENVWSEQRRETKSTRN